MKKQTHDRLKIRFTVLLTMLFVLMVALVGPMLHAPTFTDHTDELIFLVEGREEAEALAELYDLELLGVSPSKIATFKVGPMSDIEMLLEIGFAYNGQSEIVFRGGPPWQRTQNFVDEQYALEMMETFEAWSLTRGDGQVVVAIIDTGIDINHVEFSGRISPRSYNAVTELIGLDAVMDDHGHGTMVAGVIAADQTNDAGIAGIIQDVSLLVIKANEANEGRFLDSALIEGIYYAVNEGAHIINLSLGGSYANPLTKSALEYAQSQGVIVIGAAGNDGTDDPKYPASFETVLSISAVTASRALADFSNFGDYIVLSAPGADIVTTVRNNGYGTVSGTSFAAPQVTGVVALMLSYFGVMSVDAVHTRLFLTAMDEGEQGWDPLYGFGIVNTWQALSADLVTVTFETFEGTSISPVVVMAGMPFELPEDPKRSDHVFEGWFLDSAFNQPFLPGDSVETDITLYARFNAAFHTVRFITEGEAIESLIVAHGETFTLLQSSLEGYHFKGWFLDEAKTIPYTGEPVEADLTLYAMFEPIVYHTMTLMVEGLLSAQITVEEGTVFSPEPLEKVGYQFVGWYVDETFETPYTTQVITQAWTLYGQFVPEVYLVTLMDHETMIAQDWIAYGTWFVPEPLQDTTLTFVDWYVDAALTMRYEPIEVTGEMTLFAKFVEVAFDLDFIVDETVIKTQRIAEGESPILFEPEQRGYTFEGWYEDDALTIAYETQPMTANLQLYARFTLKQVDITFLAADLETVLAHFRVLAGSDVTAPEGPVKPADPYFTYQFDRWSASTESVFEDMIIVPLYAKVFIEGSIHLSPGIDTITVNTPWLDAGLNLTDDRFEIMIESTLDLTRPGKYALTYHILYEGESVTDVRRHVRVIAAFEPIEIILNEGITTIQVGGVYRETGATSSSGTVEISGLVDTQTPGVYTIIYRVTMNGSVFEHVRYVHVIDNETGFEPMIGLIIKDRKGRVSDAV